MNNPFSFKRLALLGLSSAAFLTLAACQDEVEQQAPPRMAVSVITAEPEATKIFSTMTGRVNAIREAVILARVTGNIEDIAFEQGGRVEAGDVLFTIDPKPYQAAYNQAAAALKQAEASAASANALARRYRGLVDSAAISRQEYDNAMAQAGLTNASVEQARAALDTASINLGYTQVESPIDGIIGRAQVTEGALVSQTTGQPLAIVQQLDEVYVDFNQTTVELSQLRRAVAEGSLRSIDGETLPVELVLEDGSTYGKQGRLLFTGVDVNPTTGQVELRAVFPNPDHVLLPGMYVQVRLARAQVSDALFVPNQAILRTAEGINSLMIVDDENIVRQPNVVTGQEIGERTQILSGIEPGARVVVEGFTKIRAGQPVNPQPWRLDPKADGASGDAQAASGAATEEPASSQPTTQS